MLEGAALVGLLKAGAELAAQLVEWTKKQVQSSGWRKRLTAANRELLLRTADIEAIREVIRLAEEAGYSGPELRATKRRLKHVMESGIDSSGRRVPVTSKKKASKKDKRSAARRKRVNSGAGARSNGRRASGHASPRGIDRRRTLGRRNGGRVR